MKKIVAMLAAGALAALAVPATAAAAGGSMRLPNNGFFRPVCDGSEIQYVTKGTLHVARDWLHLNGMAMLGVGVAGTADQDGNVTLASTDGQPIGVTKDGTLTNPADVSRLVLTGTKYSGNFRDNTASHTLADGTVWGHVTGGSTITGTNGTVEVNSINGIGIWPAGTTDFESDPTTILSLKESSSCSVNGTVIYQQ